MKSQSLIGNVIPNDFIRELLGVPKPYYCKSQSLIGNVIPVFLSEIGLRVESSQSLIGNVIHVP